MMTLAQELVNSRDRHGGNQYKAIVEEVLMRLKTDPEIHGRLFEYEVAAVEWRLQLGKLSSDDLMEIGQSLGINQIDLSLLLGWGITPHQKNRDDIVAGLEAIIKERQGG